MPSRNACVTVTSTRTSTASASAIVTITATVTARRPAAPPAPPTAPLTHHDILGLMGPFTRRGRQLDLPASDRLARRLLFKPVLHADPANACSHLSETLQLDNPEDGHFRLTRVTTHPGGLQASLQIEGPEPGVLLDGIDAVAPERQFQQGRGWLIAQSHRVKPGAPHLATHLVLTHGVVQFDGLTLRMRVPGVSGISAEIEALATAGSTMALPEDLLAVLGWHWSPLERGREKWTSSLRLRSSEPDRSRDAGRKLERMARHLAQTFAEPPGRFHERQVGARWGVAFRRAIPLLTCVGLMAGALAVPSLDLGPDSIFRMLIFHAPPLLLMLGICMREMPRFEIPPLPRASSAPAWLETPTAPR